MYIWGKGKGISKEFDNNQTSALYTDWLYDPRLRLSTVDCDWTDNQCDLYWSSKREGNLAFGPAKAVR